MSDEMTIYALDLDEELLSHIADPNSWTALKAEAFDTSLIEDDFVKRVYKWQKAHDVQYGRPATATVLGDEFPDLELSSPETVVGDLVDRLRYRYAKNRQRSMLEDLVRLQNEDPMAVVPFMGKMFKELSTLMSRKGEMFGNGDFERAMGLYDAKVNQGRGASYGHPDLDEYFYGMRGLNFIVAPPKTYKSWYIIQCAMANIMDGTATWLSPLELPADETYQRLVHLVSGVPYWHYLRNCISRDERKIMKDATDLLDDSGLFRVHKPAQGERSIEQIVNMARDAGSGIVLIDQLQYLEGTNGLSIGALNHTGEYWNVLNRARDLTDAGPIMIAHQFNRSAMFSDKMPSMEQIKGSSAVEETATLALGQWASADMRKSGKLEIGVLCARNYQYAAWEMDVELSRGCEFQIVERVPDEEA